MKILVTGATGFIGNHLINELLKNKKFKIVATSRNMEKAQTLDWFSKVVFIPYDLKNRSELNLFKLFGKPKKVIHLSWEGLSDYNNFDHLEKILFDNFYFIKNLIQNGLNDISITGTCFEYGMKNGILSEVIPPEPITQYGIAKDVLRKLLISLKPKYNFDYKWIRLFYMYGEGQRSNSLISLLDSAIRDGEKEFKMSGGKQIRDYLPVEQVVKYLIKISEQNNIKGIINCCSGKPTSIKELVERHLKINNHKIKLKFGYYPYTVYEPMAFWGDTTKLKKILH
jgi:nucleoside-diphosphate-sugar epimerase